MNQLPSSMVADCGAQHVVPVVELSAVSTPGIDGVNRRAKEYLEDDGWDGHRWDTVERHLKGWTMPQRIREIKDAVEESLSDGIPDIRRRVEYNQDYGILDDAFISDIASGFQVENPFWRWTKTRMSECSVAVCMDGSSHGGTSPTVIQSRMSVSMGLVSALENLGYDSTLVVGHMSSMSVPRGRDKRSDRALCMTLKGWDEPVVDSGCAHMADTGIKRLVHCWTRWKSGGSRAPYSGCLSNAEWRQLLEADLFIWVGPNRRQRSAINCDHISAQSEVGPKGRDALRLMVNYPADIDPACDSLKEFFKNLVS